MTNIAFIFTKKGILLSSFQIIQTQVIYTSNKYNMNANYV